MIVVLALLLLVGLVVFVAWLWDAHWLIDLLDHGLSRHVPKNKHEHWS